jgi:uncharacterized protein YpiB (UPF0302 family)
MENRVLEVYPMEKHDLGQDVLLGLFAEILLDKAVQEFRKRDLYKQIDKALATRDEKKFLILSEQWKKILESQK